MKYASAVLELGGMAAAGYGAYLLAPWVGWIAIGALAVLVGQAMGSEKP